MKLYTVLLVLGMFLSQDSFCQFSGTLKKFISLTATTTVYKTNVKKDFNDKRIITVDIINNKISLSPMQQFGNFNIVSKEEFTHTDGHYLIRFKCKDDFGIECICWLSSEGKSYFFRTEYNDFSIYYFISKEIK